MINTLARFENQGELEQLQNRLSNLFGRAPVRRGDGREDLALADWAPLADLKVGPEAAPIPDDIAARLREVERNAGWAIPKLDLATPSP